MGEGILNKTTLYVEKETVEGTYRAPQSGKSAVSAQEDGANEFVNMVKEPLERTNLTASLDKSPSRSGIKSVNGTIAFELKAGDSEGVPEYAPFIESAMGGFVEASADAGITPDRRQENGLTFLAQASHAASEFVVFKSLVGTAEESTLTFKAQATHEPSEVVTFEAKDGTIYAVMLDKTGTDPEPEFEEWVSVPEANKKIVNISGDTTDAEVAASVKAQLDLIVGIDLKIEISIDDEVITLKQIEKGSVNSPQSYLVDGESGNVDVDIETQGFDHTPFAFMLDKTGTDPAPAVDEWVNVPADNKKVVDISGDTTDAEVAASVKAQLDLIDDIEEFVEISVNDEVISLTQIEDGPVDIPVSYLVDGEGGHVLVTMPLVGVLNSETKATFDTTDFSIGDIVVFKDGAGKIKHVSPLISKTAEEGTFLIPHSESMTTLSIAKVMNQYKSQDSGHPSLSITKYITSNDVNFVEEYARGSKCASLSVENFNTGAQPTISFTYEGLGFNREVKSPEHAPEYDSSMPIIALCVKLYKNGESIDVNELSFNLDNTLAFRTTVTSCDGRTGSRVSAREITGSLSPYKLDSSIENFELWLKDQTFSLFGWAFNPDLEGNKTEVVAFYLPRCQFTEIAQADLDGILQEPLPFAARAYEGGAFRLGFC